MPARPAPTASNSAAGSGLAASVAGLPWWIHAAALLVACIVVYSPSLHGVLLWDDAGHVTAPYLRSIPGLIRIWFEPGATQQYYPLLHSAFWLEHRIWGDAPLGYHLANVIQHALAATLVGLVVRRLALPGAWLAAWLFALHPVAVESVAWIAEQKNTLSAVFYLAAALIYLRFDTERTPGRYAAATALFVAALLSKTVSATLPAALLVVFWWQRGKLSWRRDVVPLLPWFVLSAGAAWMTAWTERHHIGATGEAFALTFQERLLIAGRAPWFYLGKLLWPDELVFVYPRWTLDPASLTQWLFPLGAAAVGGALGWLAWRRRQRGPLAGFLIFGGTLFPALGFINVYPFLYSFVADHFQYLARLGVLVPLAAGWMKLAPRVPRGVVSGTAIVVCVALGWLSLQLAPHYREPIALWEHTLAQNPSAWMARTNLGIELTAAGKPAEAHEQFLAAIQLHPDYAEGRANLGDSFNRLGRPAEALPHLQRAIELRPDFADAHNDLGAAFMQLGRSAEGFAAFEHALKLKPNLTRARLNLGLALARAGRTAEAIEHFQRAVADDPDSAEPQLQLGRALLLSGKPDAALPHLDRAAALQPENAEAQFIRGYTLARLDRPTSALDALGAAAELAPQRADIRGELARVLRQLGHTEEANEQAREAARLGQRN